MGGVPVRRIEVRGAAAAAAAAAARSSRFLLACLLAFFFEGLNFFFAQIENRIFLARRPLACLSDGKKDFIQNATPRPPPLSLYVFVFQMVTNLSPSLRECFSIVVVGKMLCSLSPSFKLYRFLFLSLVLSVSLSTSISLSLSLSTSLSLPLSQRPLNTNLSLSFNLTFSPSPTTTSQYQSLSLVLSLARRLRRVEQPQPVVPLHQPQQPLADLAHELASEQRAPRGQHGRHLGHPWGRRRARARPGAAPGRGRRRELLEPEEEGLGGVEGRRGLAAVVRGALPLDEVAGDIVVPVGGGVRAW